MKVGKILVVEPAREVAGGYVHFCKVTGRVLAGDLVFGAEVLSAHSIDDLKMVCLPFALGEGSDAWVHSTVLPRDITRHCDEGDGCDVCFWGQLGHCEHSREEEGRTVVAWRAAAHDAVSEVFERCVQENPHGTGAAVLLCLKTDHEVRGDELWREMEGMA